MTPEHELEIIKRAGRRMRDAQKEYFETRNSNVLKTAKTLEREFDKLLGEDPEHKDQMKLW